MSAHRAAPSLILSLVVAAALSGCGDDPKPAVTSQKPTTSAAPPAATSVASAAPALAPGKDFVAGLQIQIVWKGADRASKSVTRSQAEAKKLADELHAKARAGEDFVELAKKHSDDPDAKDRSGSVGTIKRDDGKLPVYQKLFDLEVGAMSDVLEAKTGYYILKRTQ